MITGTLGGKEAELGESSARPRSHSGVACVVQAPPGCSDHLRTDGECWWAASLIYVQTTFQRDGVKGRIPIRAWPRPLRACVCTYWRDMLRVQPPQAKIDC